MCCSDKGTIQITIGLITAAILSVIGIGVGGTLLHISHSSYNTTTCYIHSLSALKYDEGSILARNSWSFTYRLSAINETCWTTQTYTGDWTAVEKAHNNYESDNVTTCYYLTSETLCDVETSEPSRVGMELAGILMILPGGIILLGVIYISIGMLGSLCEPVAPTYPFASSSQGSSSSHESSSSHVLSSSQESSSQESSSQSSSQASSSSGKLDV